MTDQETVLDRLKRLRFEVWEHRLTVDGDATSTDSATIGVAHWLPDGALGWTPADSGGAFADRTYDRRQWALFADGGFEADGVQVPSLDLNPNEPRVEARNVSAFAAFLSELSRRDEAFRAAIAGETQDGFSHLIADMFASLPRAYLDALFPGCPTAADVVGARRAAGLTLSRIGFYPDADRKAGEAAPREIVADYRFLIAEPLSSDSHRDDYMAYGEGFDVTNNVLAVSATLGGAVVDVSVES